MLIIRERAPRGSTRRTHGMGVFPLICVHVALDGTHASHARLSFLVRVTIRLRERPGRFTHAMNVAHLVRQIRTDADDDVANGALLIRQNPCNHDVGRQKVYGFSPQNRTIGV
jgi:hypothetical protein